MSHGCAYMRPGWDLEACCFWPFLEHSSRDPPPQVAESEVSTGPLYGPTDFRHSTGLKSHNRTRQIEKSDKS